MCSPGAAQKWEAPNIELKIELNKQATDMARGAYVQIEAAKNRPRAAQTSAQGSGCNARGTAAWRETPGTRCADLRMSETSCSRTLATPQISEELRWTGRVEVCSLGLSHSLAAPATCAGDCRNVLSDRGRGICTPTVTLNGKGRPCEAHHSELSVDSTRTTERRGGWRKWIGQWRAEGTNQHRRWVGGEAHYRLCSCPTAHRRRAAHTRIFPPALTNCNPQQRNAHSQMRHALTHPNCSRRSSVSIAVCGTSSMSRSKDVERAATTGLGARCDDARRSVGG